MQSNHPQATVATAQGRTALIGVAVLLLGIGLAAPVSAGCAPERLLKVVYRDVTPGVDRASFAAKPRTLYRLGRGYGRLEEMPDPDAAVHRLLVTDQPDTWVVDLRDGTGRHIVDPGPTYELRAPVVTLDSAPHVFQALEFGCEAAFFRQHGAKRRKKEDLNGTICKPYEMKVDDFRVRLCLEAGTRKPLQLTVFKGEEAIRVLHYEVYEDDLPADLDLFRAPAGITYEEDDDDHAR